MGDSTCVTRKVYPRPDFPQQGWIFKATGDLWEAPLYAGIDAQAEYSIRTPRRQDRRPLWSWTDDLGWYSANFVVFDPAQLSWVVPGDQTPKRRLYWSSDPPKISWLVPPVIYHEEFWAPNEWTHTHLRPPKRKQWTSDPLELSWLVPSVIYHEEFWPPNESAHEHLWPRKRRQWTSDPIELSWLFQETLFDAAIWPSIEQLARSYELRWRHGRPWISDPDVGWLFTNLPPFDPSLVNWLVLGDQTSRRRGFPDQLFSRWGGGAAILDVGVVHPALHQLLQSLRASARTNQDWRRLLTEPLPAWIFSTLPVFDPAILSWAIPDVRMSRKQGRPVWWVFDPDVGWITVNVPPSLRLLMMTGVGI